MNPDSCAACGRRGSISERYRLRGHRILWCGACGLMRVADIPAPESLRTLYDGEFFAAGGKFGTHAEPSAGATRNAQLRLGLIDRRPGALLDVGCATGEFLVCARDQGWQVAGVEWSPVAAEVARRRGIDVQCRPFLEAAFDGRRFDVITLWDYIEHVPDPAEHLGRAFSLLEPGGFLLLSTGDTQSLFARLSGRRWHLMIPPKHLFYFGRGNIGKMLEQSGFSVRWIRWPGKYVNLGFLARKGATLFPSAFTRGVARLASRAGLDRVDLYLNLRDIMTVASARP